MTFMKSDKSNSLPRAIRSDPANNCLRYVIVASPKGFWREGLLSVQKGDTQRRVSLSGELIFLGMRARDVWSGGPWVTSE